MIMKKNYLLLAFLICSLQAKSVVELQPLKKERIEELARFISVENTGYGQPYTHRQVWDSLAAVPKYKQLIEEAEKLLGQPFPMWSDSLYLIFSKEGVRPEGEKMIKARLRWLPVLVWAECLENKGRFVASIELTLTELCEQPTWVLPAHDWHLENFKETNPNVDLAAATQANQLGQALYLLGDKMRPKIIEIVKERLFCKIFNPVLTTIRTLDKRHYWLTVQNNWNSVCIAGVTGAALAVIEDVTLRAEFVAMAERYAQNGIEGFSDDGYCPEGLGYYNYGFGNFVFLREAVWKATAGRVDFFNQTKIAKIATYAVRTEINNGVYPSITDCRIGTTPAPWLLWYCNRNLNLGLNNIQCGDIPLQTELDLLTDQITAFSNSICVLDLSAASNDCSKAYRSFFEKAGLLLCRPSDKYSKTGLAVGIKGGTNGESHNHNDVGSYSIVAGDEELMGDPGGPTAYTNKTFSNVRYSLYKSFSSVGHPVPLIDGKEQFESINAKAVIIDTLFSDKEDRLTFDISSTYKVDGLQKIDRMYVYNRKKEGGFQVTDLFEASRAIEFETAVTTRSEIVYGKDYLELLGDKHQLRITVKSSGTFSFEEQKIADYAMIPFTRIAIRLNEKATKGSITLHYKMSTLKK